LDAGYNGSYPTSGTTWNNISGVSGGTGTLTNGPTYSTDGGGSIVFDGVDDIVNLSSLQSFNGTSPHTYNAWVNMTSFDLYDWVLNNGSDSAGTSLIIYNGKIGFFYGGGSAVVQSTTLMKLNTWYNICVTYLGNTTVLMYLNGVLDATKNTTSPNAGPGVSNWSSGNTNPRLGSWYGGSDPFGGKISNVQTYNRSLSASEIFQNYQAQLPTIVGENFITNGLVLYLDAKYKTSYPGTGTTWNNVSGVSGGTNTLVNGPVYSGTSGGTITFDGVDDYVDFNAPNLGTTTTVEMWCKIGSGYSGKMFFGWNLYDVWCGGGNIGYNTAASDIYGISSSVVSSLGLVNNWKHYVFEMRSDVSYTNNKMYINGIPQTLSQQLGSESIPQRNFNNGNGRIGYWLSSGGGSFFMPMECAVFKVYNRALTQNEINQNFNATKSRFGI
jgi:hypothetical protein